MILILDSRDSFVFNLDQGLRALGAETTVLRTDRISAAEALDRPLTGLVLSPGPGQPRDAGCLLRVVEQIPVELPVLGVCLGAQALAVAAGAQLRRSDRIYHGRCSRIRHDEQGLFTGLPNPLLACRYHSLVIDPDTLPDCYRVTATAAGSSDAAEPRDVIMGIRHRDRPWFGLQFHPESFRTELGEQMLVNFLTVIREGTFA